MVYLFEFETLRRFPWSYALFRVPFLGLPRGLLGGSPTRLSPKPSLEDGFFGRRTQKSLEDAKGNSEGIAPELELQQGTSVGVGSRPQPYLE